jgi:hypothetical protein
MTTRRSIHVSKVSNCIDLSLNSYVVDTVEHRVGSSNSHARGVAQERRTAGIQKLEFNYEIF